MLVILAVSLTASSGVATAQEKRPDQAAVVDSFKQKIQDVLKEENSTRGPEHVVFVSRTETKPAPPVIVPVHGKGISAGWVPNGTLRLSGCRL
jgi:hypothetical protein